jgi:mannose-6-phosphate isomerase-like protein (cupin superfamily)
MPGFSIVQLDRVPPQTCPCGTARRAFADAAGNVASLHIVEIRQDARAHYHRQTTEIYLVLEGEGQMELDGHLHAVRPMTAVYIPPGCRHRAIGPLKIVNVPVPAFDPRDEYFD